MFSVAAPELMLNVQNTDMPGRSLSCNSSRACIVADAMSWAVGHDIPIQEVLPCLPFFRQAVSRGHIGFWIAVWAIAPLLLALPSPFFGDILWSVKLRRVIRDLNSGRPLGLTLSRHLRSRFPGFFLVGIQRAEEEGKLHVALPVLAHQLNYPCAVAAQRKAELGLVGVKLLTTGMTVGFLSTTVLPKFQCILDDLGGDAMHVTGFAVIAAVVSWTWTIVVGAVMLGYALRKLGATGEWVRLHLPLLGRELRRFILGDLALSMAVFLRQGDDIVAAATWSESASRSRWMKRRLKGFIGEVSSGVHWAEAWRNMGVGKPMEQWLIKNASSREDPASGFELLAEWLHAETATSTRRMAQLVDPICTLALACMIGWIAHEVYATLISMIYALT